CVCPSEAIVRESPAQFRLQYYHILRNFASVFRHLTQLFSGSGSRFNMPSSEKTMPKTPERLLKYTLIELNLAPRDCRPSTSATPSRITPKATHSLFSILQRNAPST